MTDPKRDISLDTIRIAMVIAGIPEKAVGRWNPLPKKLGADAGDGELTLRFDGPIIGSDRSKLQQLIYGTEFGMSANTVNEFLAKADGRDITLLVNSPGGEVSATGDICSQLEMYGGKITAKVVGDAASCASLVAASADYVEIGKLGMFMIHQPWSMVVGNSVKLRAEADALDKYGEGFIDIYAERMDRKRAEEMMTDGNDHWISGSEAIKLGLADARLSKGGAAPADADAKGAGAAPVRSGSDADGDADTDDDTDADADADAKTDAAGGDAEPPASDGDQNTDGADDGADSEPSDPAPSGSARATGLFGRHSLLQGLAHITPDDCAGDISHGTHLR